MMCISSCTAATAALATPNLYYSNGMEFSNIREKGTKKKKQTGCKETARDEVKQI